MGNVAVDEFLTDSAFRIASIDKGCVCCTLKSDLNETIHHLCTKFEPDLIILETTGLADPVGILKDEYDLGKLVFIEAVITAVDGVNFKKNISLFPVVKSQIQWADIVVISKADLITYDKLKEIIEEVDKINTKAPVFPVVRGNLQPGVIRSLAKDTFKTVNDDYMIHNEGSETHLDKTKIVSITLTMDGHFVKEELCRVLDCLPSSVYRMKGVIRIYGLDETQLFQFVFGRYEFSSFSDPGIQPNTIVVIGEGLQGEELKSLFESCLMES